MIIQSSKVYIEGMFIKAQIEIFGNKIVNIYKYNTHKVDVDYKDKLIIPGLIDLHTHGGYGYNVNTGDKEQCRHWLNQLVYEGVTSTLATTVTDDKNVLINSLKTISDVYNTTRSGANLLGIHLEGPYLDNDYKGAQPEKFIVKPNLKQFKEFIQASDNLIKYMTIASEWDESFELTKFASQNGVVVSLGHSGADFDIANLAIANGVSSITHTFNGMKALNHRSPNIVGSVISSNIYAEIIGDGHHVHPVVVNMLYKLKPHHMLLVTDSLAIKGLKSGTYDFEDISITVDKFGTAFISGTNTIAGSTLKMNEALKRLVVEMNVSINNAIDSATINCAKILRIDDHKGKIKVGFDADIVVLDKNFNVQTTYVMGKQYKS